MRHGRRFGLNGGNAGHKIRDRFWMEPKSGEQSERGGRAVAKSDAMPRRRHRDRTAILRLYIGDRNSGASTGYGRNVRRRWAAWNSAVRDGELASTGVLGG